MEHVFLPLQLRVILSVFILLNIHPNYFSETLDYVKVGNNQNKMNYCVIVIVFLRWPSNFEQLSLNLISFMAVI